MPSDNNPTRRTALRNILVISGGLCIAALGMRSLLSSKAILSDAEAAPVTIKVVYVGMSTQTSGIRQEYLTLSPPVHLDDVFSKLKQDHANFASMLPIMQVVVNGVPTHDNPLLQDNTEVDFIPIYAGG